MRAIPVLVGSLEPGVVNHHEEVTAGIPRTLGLVLTLLTLLTLAWTLMRQEAADAQDGSAGDRKETQEDEDCPDHQKSTSHWPRKRRVSPGGGEENSLLPTGDLVDQRRDFLLVLPGIGAAVRVFRTAHSSGGGAMRPMTT